MLVYFDYGVAIHEPDMEENYRKGFFVPTDQMWHFDCLEYFCLRNGDSRFKEKQEK